MSEPEQIEVTTKLGTIRAWGSQTPIIIIVALLLAASTWFLHSDNTSANDKRETAFAAYGTKLDTLIQIECAIYRKQNPMALIPQCL